MDEGLFVSNVRFEHIKLENLSKIPNKYQPKEERRTIETNQMT